MNIKVKYLDVKAKILSTNKLYDEVKSHKSLGLLSKKHMDIFKNLIQFMEDPYNKILITLITDVANTNTDIDVHNLSKLWWDNICNVHDHLAIFSKEINEYV